MDDPRKDTGTKPRAEGADDLACAIVKKPYIDDERPLRVGDRALDARARPSVGGRGGRCIRTSRFRKPRIACASQRLPAGLRWGSVGKT
jgi:hypothetical protein